jgi:XTP/dITP diphosphohydrolase
VGAERAGLVPQRAAGSAPTIELDQLDQRSLGALLFEIVAVARERGLDAEEALRLAIRDFRASVAAVEATRQV